MFPRENIQHMTENIGFLDSEIMWLYTFFTDTKISPVTYTLGEFEKTFEKKNYEFSRDGKICKYIFPGNGNFYTVYMVDESSDRVHRVEYVADGLLIRKDYFTYCRIYSEYYAPLDNKAHMYQRRFFNEDGSVAYEEINDDDVVMYQFPDRLLCSKEELVGYMASRLNLTSEDVVIIDRTTGVGQAIMQNAGPARIGIIIHADHFSETNCNDDYILWNNYYEYAFSQNKHVDFYVTATDAQNQLLKEQFEKYLHVSPRIVTIPVGSLDELKYPAQPRRPYSLITASRLAGEKHVNWVVAAAAQVHEQLPQLPVIRLLQPLFSGDACRRENVTVRHHMNVHGFQTFPVLRILARIHKHLLRHKAHRIENVIVQIFFYHTGCILHGIILQFHAQNADFLRHIHHLQFCFSITMICFFVQTYLSH